MITNYDPGSVYLIFEISDTSKRFKIGEIENGVFYDVDKHGKRIGNGFRFSNTSAFWSQFKRIEIKKIEKPLGGYESIAWGAYWTISAIISIILIGAAEEISARVTWIVLSGLHMFIAVKYRHNKYVVYWMIASTVIVLLLMYAAGKKTKK